MGTVAGREAHRVGMSTFSSPSLPSRSNARWLTVNESTNSDVRSAMLLLLLLRRLLLLDRVRALPFLPLEPTPTPVPAVPGLLDGFAVPEGYPATCTPTPAATPIAAAAAVILLALSRAAAASEEEPCGEAVRMDEALRGEGALPPLLLLLLLPTPVGVEEREDGRLLLPLSLLWLLPPLVLPTPRLGLQLAGLLRDGEGVKPFPALPCS